VLAALAGAGFGDGRDPGRDDCTPLLSRAPSPPAEYYDLFGTELTKEEAADVVRREHLDPHDPSSYSHVGMVHVTPELVAAGENIFATRKIGDDFGLQAVLGFGAGFALVQDDVYAAIAALGGHPTTNLVLTLSSPLTIGTQTFPAGSQIPTGIDVDKNGVPIGVTTVDPDIPGAVVPGITCAICHAQVNLQTGEAVLGLPNIDIGTALLIALAPNSAAGFARLKLNPLDPAFQGPGSREILDSHGNIVSLPDPEIFEAAMDDLVLLTPYGNFESSADGINDTTNIPFLSSYANVPSGWDGAFGVGPFGGVAMISTAVHTSEINLLAAAQLSGETIGVDREVYIATALQNAADPAVRYTPSLAVPPSAFLAAIRAADPNHAELEDVVQQPQPTTYPDLNPSLVTYDGLIFSPNTGNPEDPASGDFMYAVNAMAAFQNTLTPPPNTSAANAAAIASGSVERGARVFLEAGCQQCHYGSTFNDGRVHPVSEIQSNPGRAESHLGLEPFLVAPKIYPFDTVVTNGGVPEGTTTIELPTAGYSRTPTSLVIGDEPNGGYKTPTLRGLYVTAPYLHDGGVAVAPGALVAGPGGWFYPAEVVGGVPIGLGLPFTLQQALPADPANSLRALLDRTIRGYVVAVNESYNGGTLTLINVQGVGHDFYVDAQAGATPEQQTDLINFLLALDDDPLH
jgi:cytochrome c5